MNTGTLAAPNISVCEPNLSGITTVTATASTFAEIRVYNSNLADGFVFATVPANGQVVRETGSWVKNGTEFRLVTPLASGVELARVAVVVTQRACPNAPTVDIKANGSDGPVTVVSGSSVVLTWQSQNATQCQAESGWTTNTGVAGQESVVVGRRTLFSIVCTGAGGSARDVVEVLVTPIPPVLPPLVDAWVYNGATAPAGITPACNQIAAVWTKSERAVSGYRVYYYNPDTASWVRLVDIPNAQLQPFGERFQTVFAAPSTTVALRYRVYAYLDAVEYVATRDASGSPLLPVPCGGSANLAPSNKDIVKIRSIDLCAVGVCNPYNDQDSPVKPALPVTEGDAVTFAINLVNGGSEPIAGPIAISDVLTNMAEPKNGFQITASCNNQCSVSVDGYNAATKTIRMTVTPVGKNTLAGGSQEVWTISMAAETKAPSNKRGQPFRFRNQAFVNGVTGPLLTTPYILVLPVGTPTIEEIQ